MKKKYLSIFLKYFILFISVFIFNQMNSQNIVPPLPWDHGDAPNTYGGAVHALSEGLVLGTKIDFMDNIIASVEADGDDKDNIDDEDGVEESDLEGILTSSESFSLNVSYINDNSVLANLYGWIDFNRNGTFDVDEFTSINVPVNSEGVVTLTWSNLLINGVEINAGITYARFRITTNTLLSNDSKGEAYNGEVEDYVLVIAEGTLGLDDEVLNQSVKIYPNPVRDFLSVDSEKRLVTKIEIYSALGQRIKEVNSNFNFISTEKLSKGIYLLRIYSENGTIVRKLVKQ